MDTDNPPRHERTRDAGGFAKIDQPVRRSNYPDAPMPTRYLIVGALITALVILVGVGLWFLLGVI